MRTSTTLTSTMRAIRLRRRFALARRAFALGSLSLGGKQFERRRCIGLRDESFQPVQQVERPQQRDEIAQSDGAGFFKPLQRRQSNAAFARGLDLGQGSALRRNSPSLDGPAKALGDFRIGKMIE